MTVLCTPVFNVLKDFLKFLTGASEVYVRMPHQCKPGTRDAEVAQLFYIDAQAIQDGNRILFPTNLSLRAQKAN